MNHYYTSIKADGMFTFPDLYSEVVNFSPKGSKFIEIGCWKGQSTAFLAVEIENSQKDIKLYCVDIWKGDGVIGDYDSYLKMCASESTSDVLYQTFLQNIEPVKHIIEPIRMTSVEASKLFEDEYFDFVFLDASHEYPEIKDDIIHWYPKVKKNGIFAGHDYRWRGVFQAVSETIKEPVVEMGLCWKILKTEESLKIK